MRWQPKEEVFAGSYFLSGNPAPIEFAGMQGMVIEVAGNCAFVLVIMHRGESVDRKTLIPLEKMVGFHFFDSLEATIPFLTPTHTKPRPPAQGW